MVREEEEARAARGHRFTLEQSEERLPEVPSWYRLCDCAQNVENSADILTMS